jgi:hypothetical protein
MAAAAGCAASSEGLVRWCSALRRERENREWRGGYGMLLPSQWSRQAGEWWFTEGERWRRWISGHGGGGSYERHYDEREGFRRCRVAAARSCGAEGLNRRRKEEGRARLELSSTPAMAAGEGRSKMRLHRSGEQVSEGYAGCGGRGRLSPCRGWLGRVGVELLCPAMVEGSNQRWAMTSWSPSLVR